MGARVVLRPRSADGSGGGDEDLRDLRLRWTVTYNRGLGQAVVKFNGPMRAFLAVQCVDVCFQPESLGLLPTPGRLVADGAALS